MVGVTRTLLAGRHSGCLAMDGMYWCCLSIGFLNIVAACGILYYEVSEPKWNEEAVALLMMTEGVMVDEASLSATGV